MSTQNQLNQFCSNLRANILSDAFFSEPEIPKYRKCSYNSSSQQISMLEILRQAIITIMRVMYSKYDKKICICISLSSSLFTGATVGTLC